MQKEYLLKFLPWAIGLTLFLTAPFLSPSVDRDLMARLQRAAKSNTDVEAWRYVCDRLANRSISSASIRGHHFTAAECYVAVASRTNRPRDWIAASLQLQPNDTFLYPRPITKSDVAARATRFEPGRAELWLTLAAMMAPLDVVSIAGRIYSKLEAFLQALALDGAREPSWFELGRAMSASDRVTIGGKVYTRVAAFARAVELAPTTLGSWGYLGSSLAKGETVSVAGVPVGRRECFRRVVSLDAKHAIGWLNLGTELGGGSKVVVAGVQYNQRDCFVMCLRSNPHEIGRHAALLVAEGNAAEASALFNRLAAAHGSGNTMHEATQTARKLASLNDGVLNVTNVDRRVDSSINCVRVLSYVINAFAKDSVALHLMRAECALKARDQRVAKEELSYLLPRGAGNLAAVALYVTYLRRHGSITDAKEVAYHCLSLDAEDVRCSQLLKSLLSYPKATQTVLQLVRDQRWSAALNAIDAVLEEDVDPPNLEELQALRCVSYHELKYVKKSIEACTTAITLERLKDDQSDARAVFALLLRRAEMYLLDDAIEAAAEDIEKVAAIDGNHQRVRWLQQKMKQITEAPKDYFAILGIHTSASDEEIKNAFRKLARQYHPDRYQSKDISDADRMKFHRRFRDVNEAKGVLLDARKRRAYDSSGRRGSWSEFFSSFF